MRHAGQKAVLGGIGVGQFDIFFVQGEFDLLALADIANGAHDEHTLFRLDGTEADLDGELLAALAQAVQVASRAHGPHLRLGEIVAAVAHVGHAQAGRHQLLEQAAAQLAAAIAEQGFRLAVGQHDAAAGVGHDDGVRRRFEQAAEARLDQLGVAQHLEVGDVLLAPQNVLDVAIAFTDGLAGTVDVDQRAILGPAHRFVGGRARRQGLAHDGLFLAQAVRRHDQVAQHIAGRLLRAVAEHGLGARCPAQHFPGGRGQDHRVRRFIQDQGTEVCCHRRALGGCASASRRVAA